MYPQEYFARLNNRSYGATGFFAPKPIFDQRQAFVLWGSSQPDVEAAEAKLVADPTFKYKDWKTKYDRSRQTVTRTGIYLQNMHVPHSAAATDYKM